MWFFLRGGWVFSRWAFCSGGGSLGLAAFVSLCLCFFPHRPWLFFPLLVVSSLWLFFPCWGVAGLLFCFLVAVLPAKTRTSSAGAQHPRAEGGGSLGLAVFVSPGVVFFPHRPWLFFLCWLFFSLWLFFPVAVFLFPVVVWFSLCLLTFSLWLWGGVR